MVRLESTGGEVRIKVQIPGNSKEYQRYLKALKENERLREEGGGLTTEGLSGIRNAARDLDELAKKTYQRQRAS